MSTAEPSDLRARILAEATRLFMAYGYNGISMREIAEAVGVSKAGLYYHYKDKEDLFLAILNDSLGTMGQIVATARAAGPTAGDQIGALVRGLFEQPDEQRAIMRLAGQELAHVAPAARADFGRRYQEQFIGQVAAMLGAASARGELRPIDPLTLTWLLLGMMYPFFTAGHARDEAAQERTIADLLALFFDGAAAD
jgi:AcrR family transcriptional regulator